MNCSNAFRKKSDRCFPYPACFRRPLTEHTEENDHPCTKVATREFCWGICLWVGKNRAIDVKASTTHAYLFAVRLHFMLPSNGLCIHANIVDVAGGGDVVLCLMQTMHTAQYGEGSFSVISSIPADRGDQTRGHSDRTGDACR